MSKTPADTALTEALAAIERRWPVFPLANKFPLKGSHSFYDATTDRAQIEAWANANPACNWALATGTRSGVVVIDVDAKRNGPKTLERLKSEHGGFPKTPTVETANDGLHLLYASTVPIPSRVDHWGAGVELKAEGNYIVLAGSRLDADRVYRWRHSPDDTPLVEVPSWIVETAGSVTEKAEIAEAISLKSLHSLQHPGEANSTVSALSAISALSVTSADDIVTQTQPTGPGERNAKLMALARGLKFNAGMAKADNGTLKEIVRHWHRLALPRIDTKSFDRTWTDFVHAFERCKYPLDMDIVDAAALQIDPADLPEITRQYDSAEVCQLIGLCLQLSLLNKGKFFLSSHDAAPRLGVTPMTAWRMLRMLENDGVIKCLKRGNERQASRYLWLGDGGDK